VPPSPKALNWFCCQPAESSVYPLFFLSNNTDNPTYKSLYLKQSCGVFGIGAAIYFTNTSSFTSGELSSTKRLISFSLICGSSNINVGILAYRSNGSLCFLNFHLECLVTH
jgi:hypothetical protein